MSYQSFLTFSTSVRIVYISYIGLQALHQYSSMFVFSHFFLSFFFFSLYLFFISKPGPQLALADSQRWRKAYSLFLLNVVVVVSSMLYQAWKNHSFPFSMSKLYLAFIKHWISSCYVSIRLNFLITGLIALQENALKWPYLNTNKPLWWVLLLCKRLENDFRARNLRSAWGISFSSYIICSFNMETWL